MPPIYINRIETAHPPYECHHITRNYLDRCFPPATEIGSHLARIFSKLGIEKRYSVLSDFAQFYAAGTFPGTAERMRVYAEQALPLAGLALEPLFAHEDRDAITHVIVTSCTGFYAPGLDIEIIQRFGLRPTVARTLIGFMGCYAAIPALQQATHIVRSDPSARVLMVNLELCSLHFRHNAPLDQQISFLLFADGCAASIISARPYGVRLQSFHRAILPDTQHLMRWTISDEGFYMNLDEQVPAALTACIRRERDHMLDGRSVREMASWAIHPGGRAIVDAIQDELQLDDRAVQCARTVLNNYGNMSSPTLLFVLQEILRDPQQRGPGCGMAFGPGLTLESFRYSIEDA